MYIVQFPPPIRYITKGVPRIICTNINVVYLYIIYTVDGGFHKWGYPKMDGLQWKILKNWMI